jgi:uncharacterized protein (TIGR00251 family)
LFYPRWGVYLSDSIQKGVNLKLKVVPNSANFEVAWFDAPHELRVRVCSPAQKQKANKEILKKLGKLFNSKVEISKGKNSAKKTITVYTSKEKILEAIVHTGKP